MRVSELAKELKTTDEVVLARLKSLKLKAKDSAQELNSVVLSLLRADFKKSPPASAPAPAAKAPIIEPKWAKIQLETPKKAEKKAEKKN
jgi:hypothetical protein